MKKLIVLAAFLSLVSWAGATAPDSQNEVLNFKIGDDWKAVRHSDTGKGHSITYIREGDDIGHWKRSLPTYMALGGEVFGLPIRNSVS